MNLIFSGVSLNPLSVHPSVSLKHTLFLSRSAVLDIFIKTPKNFFNYYAVNGRNNETRAVFLNGFGVDSPYLLNALLFCYIAPLTKRLFIITRNYVVFRDYHRHMLERNVAQGYINFRRTFYASFTNNCDFDNQIYRIMLIENDKNMNKTKITTLQK